MQLLMQFDNPWQIAWNVLATLLIVYTLAYVVSIPASTYKHRWWTKTVVLLATALLGIAAAGYYIPLGALWALFAIKPANYRRRSIPD